VQCGFKGNPVPFINPGRPCGGIIDNPFNFQTWMRGVIFKEIKGFCNFFQDGFLSSETFQVGNKYWYIGWEFEHSPTDPFHLFLILKGLKAIIGKS